MMRKTNPALAHVAPFALWIAVILLLQLLESAGWCPRPLYPVSYALKSVACAIIFLLLKPWRGYPAFSPAYLPAALLSGIGVAVLWILPETAWFGARFPAAQRAYFEWAVLMPGSLPSYVDPAWWPSLPPGHLSWAYSPAECGWPLALAKLTGSGLVIAVVEEFFFRGFLLRWFRNSAFMEESLTKFEVKSFFLVLAVFAFEHDRWLAGAMAGAVYGLLLLRTGDIWSCAIAHGVTNTLLGIYVLQTDTYGFW
ncbi:MAG: CAAX prenyl protease-related protein [Kiritimatiellae bacterium]|nr:CAAX prenyl protease-related protein [Kiritimatiellia bacterium]